MDAVFAVVIGRGRGGGGVPDPPDPNDDDGGGGPTTTPNGPAVVGGNVEVSSSLAMGGAMGGVMSCLCVMLGFLDRGTIFAWCVFASHTRASYFMGE